MHCFVMFLIIRYEVWIINSPYLAYMGLPLNRNTLFRTLFIKVLANTAIIEGILDYGMFAGCAQELLSTI